MGWMQFQPHKILRQFFVRVSVPAKCSNVCFYSNSLKCWVHFDDEVRISGVDKKVQISNLSPLYVGIYKKRTSLNNLDFFVHSEVLDFFVLCKKVGPFALALAIKILEPQFLA